MKDYLILKDFTGSQDGIVCEGFTSGTTRKLSDSLVTSLGGPAGGFVKEAGKAAREIAEAPTELAQAVLEVIDGAQIQPRELAEGEMLEEGEIPEGSPLRAAEGRETKVTGPEETKPSAPAAKKKK